MWWRHQPFDPGEPRAATHAAGKKQQGSDCWRNLSWSPTKQATRQQRPPQAPHADRQAQFPHRDPSDDNPALERSAREVTVDQCDAVLLDSPKEPRRCPYPCAWCLASQHVRNCFDTAVACCSRTSQRGLTETKNSNDASRCQQRETCMIWCSALGTRAWQRSHLAPSSKRKPNNTRPKTEERATAVTVKGSISNGTKGLVEQVTFRNP